jgi:TRAP-type uncharacterized transport system substrate-binding protein
MSIPSCTPRVISLHAPKWAQERVRAQLRVTEGVARLAVAVLLAMMLEVASAGPALAQAPPKSGQDDTEAALKERKNAWTVGVAGGMSSGSHMVFADELAQVLNDGDNLRILPIVTNGAASNIDDLLYLRGVDVVMTNTDILEYFRTEKKTPDIEKKVRYLVRLPVSEMHLLARTEIRGIEDLRGKKVNFGPAGSASNLSGPIVFQRLGVQVEHVQLDNATALRKLQLGELDALVHMTGKPIDFFARIPSHSGLHLVPVPFSKTVGDSYTYGELTAKEYPTLVPEGQTIETIAVPAVLAVFNWPKYTDRYRRLERFTEALFTKWDQFREPPRHPKWRDVNLAATVPGWARWSVAEEMVKRVRQSRAAEAKVATGDFLFFLVTKGSSGPDLTEEQREMLFLEFLEWKKQQITGQR